MLEKLIELLAVEGVHEHRLDLAAIEQAANATVRHGTSKGLEN